MQITDVTVHTLSSRIDPPQEREFWGGIRRLLKRDFVLAIIETSRGNVGYAPAGASSSAMREFFEGSSHDTFADLLESRVADVVRDVDLDSPEDIAAIIRSLDLPTKLESEAIGVFDVAYHDLRGKEIGMPVYEMLAESEINPDPLPMYASAGMYMEPEGYAEQAAALHAEGFEAYKYRPAGPPTTDKETIRAIRETVGDGMEIMADAHTWWKLGDRSYDFATVVDVIEGFATSDPYWVEEPVEPADYDAYSRLTEKVDVPIAGGESEESPAGLERLLTTGVDYLQGDVRHHCGFTGCWSLVKQCVGRTDVTFVPHNFGTDLGLIANAHLVAASPESPLLEYPVFGDGTKGMYPFPLAEDILETDLTITEGRLILPDDPGLGVEVNHDAIDEYEYVEGPWTEFVYKDATGGT